VAKESDRHDSVPMTSESSKVLAALAGPMEGTKEHRSLEESVGFAYRQVLGELVYAYVVCRLDIGYAVTFLSCFAQSPAKEHYLALKAVAKYL